MHSHHDELLAGLDPTRRFSDRVADYVKWRPDYPAAAYDCMLDGLDPPDTLVAADVGAGTGISSRQLADRGPRVLAIEPNAAMRDAATPHPRVEWRDGSAEGPASSSRASTWCSRRRRSTGSATATRSRSSRASCAPTVGSS